MEQADSSLGFEPRVYDDGRVLFASRKLGKLQEEHPVSGEKFYTSEHLPFGWERVVTDADKILFVNHLKQTTTYEDPRLPTLTLSSSSTMPPELKQIFDANSTTAQVLNGVNLTGKTFLVTGGTSGVGAATVKALATHGAHVVFTGRNVSAAAEIKRNLEFESPNALVDFVPLDLSALDSVRYFAESLIRKQLSLDCLILDAGVFGVPHEVTVDGFESMFQVNVLSQLYLLILLRPLLTDSATGARVIFVSSESHRASRVTTSSLSHSTLSPSAQTYSAWSQYNNTKLYQIALSHHLQRTWNNQLTFYALHPGNMILTNLSRSWWVWKLLFVAVKPFTKSVDQGAATTVYCATADNLAKEGGKYWNNCWICESSEVAEERGFQTSLWAMCVEMLGDRVSGDKLNQ